MLAAPPVLDETIMWIHPACFLPPHSLHSQPAGVCLLSGAGVGSGLVRVHLDQKVSGTEDEEL